MTSLSADGPRPIAHIVRSVIVGSRSVLNAERSSIGCCGTPQWATHGQYIKETSSREFDFAYAEDWCRRMMRGIESHRVRFTLSADFTAATHEEMQIFVDEIWDVPKCEFAGEGFS